MPLTSSDSITSRPVNYYSPLRYPGGKASLSNYFHKLIVRNNISNCTYIEPYAGGIGAGLTLLIHEKVDYLVINDYDKAIYSFWKSIIFYTSDFIKKIAETEISLSEREKQKVIYNDKNSSEIDLGFATFFLNRTNYSGIINGGPIGGKSQKSKWKITARFNKSMLINKIKRISNYSSRISLYNMDGIGFMRKYCDYSNIFVYIDPPYYKKGKSLYHNHYLHKEHSELANFLNKKSDFNWILTYDNVSEILNLYPHRKKVSFDLQYHANQHKIGNELLIFSDKIIY